MNSPKNRIESQGIKQLLLTSLADVWPQETCAWIAGRRVSVESKQKLEQALADVELVLSTFTVRPDISDAAEVRKLVEMAHGESLRNVISE